MSDNDIQKQLRILEERPDDENALSALEEAVAGSNGSDVGEPAARLLEAARRLHLERGDFDTAVRLLELELVASKDTERELELRTELARLFTEELFDDKRAIDEHQAILKLRPDHDTSSNALERIKETRENWKKIAEKFLETAETATDGTLKTDLFQRVAELYLKNKPKAKEVEQYLRRALQVEPRNRRAASILERVLRKRGKYDDLCTLLQQTGDAAASRDDKVTALLAAGRVAAEQLDDRDRAAKLYAAALDYAPGHPSALRFLVGHYTDHEDWDHLVALYEDALKGRGRTESEQAILLQIGMTHWRMRQDAGAAEPYFHRLRKAEPTHPVMLNFYRDVHASRGEWAKLLQVLSDAQRLVKENDAKIALGAEIARLAEEHLGNVERAIDAWKAIQRLDPSNTEAPAALKRLFERTEKWNALLDVLKAEAEALPPDAKAARIAIFEQMVAIYRDKLQLDVMVINTFNAILAIDPTNQGALESLSKTFETMGRWSDLITILGRRADVASGTAAKVAMLGRIASLWIDRFANYNQAVRPLEQILELEPGNAAAMDQLRDIYQKKRSWKPLFDVLRRQAEAHTGKDKLPHLVELAKLAAERLDKPAESIALWEQVLAIDPEAPGALDALEKLTEREKDWAGHVRVLESRIDAAPDAEEQVRLLVKLGEVQGDRIADPVAAAETWKRVLAKKPAHPKAARVLRELYVAAGRWDELTEMYAASNDWEGLADVLSTAADRSEVPATKVDLSGRAAAVYEGKIRAPERAARSYERILTVEPRNLRAAAALVPLYEKEERHGRLLPLYEMLSAEAKTPAEVLSWAVKLRDLCGNKLGDKTSAYLWAEKAFELDPGDPAVREALEKWATEVDAVDDLVRAYEKRAAAATKASERRDLQKRIAQLELGPLGKVDASIARQEALLKEDPDDDDAAAELERLYRAQVKHRDLCVILDRKVERTTDPAARRELALEVARIHEEFLAEPDEAARRYRALVDADPTDDVVLAALERLAESREKWDELATVLAERKNLTDGATRAAFALRLGKLHAEQGKDAHKALAELREVLELQRDDSEATAALEQLAAGDPALSLEIGTLLEPTYERTGAHAKREKVLVMQLEAARDLGERRALFERIAELRAGPLGDGAGAFDIVSRAFAEDPESTGWVDRLLTLGDALDRVEKVAEILAAAALGGLPSPDLERELATKAAELFDERLGKPEAAEPLYRKVLSFDESAVRPFQALEQLYSQRERWDELKALYEKRIEATLDAAVKVDLLGKVAFLHEEVLDDLPGAIDVYQKILDADPSHAQAEHSLERLYERTGRFRDLVELLSRRLEGASGGAAVALQFRIGELHEQKLSDAAGAVDDYSQVLSGDPLHLGAQAALERLLGVPALRQRIAGILEPLYERQGAANELARILEVQLEEVQDPQGRVGLLGRVAELREKRLQDAKGAFDAWARAVAADPGDEDARAALRRLARSLGEDRRQADVLAAALEGSTGDSSLQAGLLSELAALHDQRLGQPEDAERVYRRLFELDPGDPATVLPAAQALERLYLARGATPELIEVLTVRARFAEEGKERRQLLLRIAEAWEAILDDAPRAIETYRQILDIDALDIDALSALERLYGKTRAWTDLVGILRLRLDVAVVAERRDLHYRIAEIYEKELGDLDNAIAQYNVWLDESRRGSPETPKPGAAGRTMVMYAVSVADDRETLARLASLYERTERWGDLLETLESDLVLEKEPVARGKLLERMGAILEGKVEDVPRAIEAYRRALEESPGGDARGALERLVAGRGDHGLVAARVLVPLYEQASDHARLVQVFELEAESANDPVERSRFLRRAAEVAERGMADFPRAFDLMLRAAKDAASDSDLGEVLDRLESLAERTGRERELCDAYRALAPEVLDSEVQLRILVTVADMARKRLNDPALAREFYDKVLEVRGDHAQALDALEGLTADAGDTRALMDVLQRKIELATEPWARRDLLLKQAQVSEGPAKNIPGAIDAYEAALAIDDRDGMAGKALERLYAQAGRWDELLQLLERLRQAPGVDKIDLSHRIGSIRLQHQGDVDGAIDDLAVALAAHPPYPASVALLESLLEDKERRSQVAKILEPIYLARAEWPRVVAMVEARIATLDDPIERRHLLLRLGSLYEDQMEDLDAAFDTYTRLFKEDVENPDTWELMLRLGRVLEKQGRVAAVWEEGLAEVTTDSPETARLAYMAAQIHDERTGDLEKARALYRRAYDFDPGNAEVAFALERLYTRSGAHQDLVELHRDASQRAMDPVARKAALYKIAAIHDEVSSDAGKAIEAYREIREVDPQDATAIAALDRLYVREGRWDELVELLGECLADARTTAERVSIEHRLGTLQEEKLGNASVAVDHYEGALGLDAGHGPSIAALERLVMDGDHRYRIAKILEPIYRAQDEWRKLVVITDAQLEFINDRDERVARLREIAQIHEARGGDLRLAYRALARAVVEEPGGRELRGELERIATMLGSFGDLVADLEKALAATYDVATQIEILERVATIQDSRLGDPRAAIVAYRRILEADESNADALEALEALHMLIGDWEGLVAVLGDKADKAGEDAARKKELLRIAEILEDLVSDSARAVAAYERVLEVDPDCVPALEALDRLHGAAAAWGELVPVLRRRLEVGGLSAPDRRELQARIAQVLHGQLQDRPEAILAWRAVLDENRGDEEALSALDVLLQADGAWADLYENLSAQIEAAAGPAHRVPLLLRQGALLAKELGDPERAIDAYQNVLAIDSADATAIEALTRIAADETHRASAAAVLEPVLADGKRWPELSALLELELDLSVDVETRVALLRRIARIAEDGLGDPRAAFEATRRALAEDPASEELCDEIERLAPAAAGWLAAADAFQERADAVLDTAACRVLHLRHGRIAEARLADEARAVEAFKKALDCGGDEDESLGALDRLYEKSGAHAELAEILERRIERSVDAAQTAELEYRLGDLREERFKDLQGAVQAYRSALEREPTHPGALSAMERLLDRPETSAAAVEVLEPLYRVRGELGKVSGLFTRKIGLSDDPADKASLERELGALLRDEVGDASGAFDAYARAFAHEPTEQGTVEELSALAARTNRWADLAKVVESVLASGTLSPDEVRELSLQAAEWYQDRLSDLGGAERRLRAALEADPESTEAMERLEGLLRRPGRERDLVDLLRKRAEVDLDIRVKRDRLLEAAKLAEAVLGDAPLVEETYQSLLELDENDALALEALAGLAERAGRLPEAAELSLRRARTAEDQKLAQDLRHRVARMQAGPLGDVDAAIGTYREILDQEPDDLEAMSALEGHYEATARWADLKEALARRLSAVDAPEERIAILRRMASVSEERFRALEDAVDSLREALTLDPRHPELPAEIERLLTAGERWTDLVDFLEDRAETAAKGGDTRTELRALVRAGEIREERMGDTDRAVEIYERVLERDPQSVRALAALSRLHEKAGNWEQCIEVLERAARLPAEPVDAAEVQVRLGRLEWKQKEDAVKASEHFERALTLDPGQAEALAALGELARASGDHARLAGILEMEEKRAADPARRLALAKEIARLHLGPLASPAGALAPLERVLAQAPADKEALLQLVDAFDRLGRHEDSVPVLRKLVEAAGTSRSKEMAAVHHRLGRALEGMGDFPGALAELEKAQRIDLTNVPLLRDLGKLAHRTGDLDRAQKTFRGLLLQKLDEASGIGKADVYWYLGDILERQGDPKKALGMYERGVEADRVHPGNKEAIARLKG